MIDSKKIIAVLCIKNNYDWDKIFMDIKNKERSVFEEDEKLLEGKKFITILDDNYPKILKQTYKPPFMLNYEGDIKWLKKANDLVFVSGKSKVINIPVEKTIYVEKVEGKYFISIGGKLRIWWDNEGNYSYGFAMLLANKILITELENEEEFLANAIMLSSDFDKDIFVIPSDIGSMNNNLIKNGATLVETINDLH